MPEEITQCERVALEIIGVHGLDVDAIWGPDEQACMNRVNATVTARLAGMSQSEICSLVWYADIDWSRIDPGDRGASGQQVITGLAADALTLTIEELLPQPVG